MIPVIIIAVVFTGLAATLFYAAPRGKLAPITNTLLSQKRSTSLVINGVIVAIMVVFGFVIPAFLLVNNHNSGATAGITGGIKLTSAEVTGRSVFGEHCAVCHTLSAASAVGKTGPNLDQLKPSYALIMNTLANGCLSDPSPTEQAQSCLGQGNMPADVVQGAQARQVAEFVSRVAGHGSGT